MSGRIFFIGTTGHVGSTVLEKIVAKFPDVPVRALVRSDADAADVSRRHPSVEPVLGTLDDLEILEAEAEKSGIVINCAPDVPYALGIEAVLRGLKKRGTPSFYVHTSGGASIWAEPDGDVEGAVWDDIADIDRIASLPDDAAHVRTDRIVLGANTAHVSAAIVAPPFITGLAPSSSHPTPLTFPDLFHAVRALGGAGFVVGRGANRTSFVEVHHLAQLYLLLVGDALKRTTGNGSSGDPWGPEAYYFLTTAEMPFREFMETHLLPAIARARPDVLAASPPEIRSVTVDRVTELVTERLGGHIEAEFWGRQIAVGMGVAMRCRGSRATREFGYRPEGSLGLDESVAVFLGAR